ncbi:MAG: hypothetical protein IJZ86_09575 [Bacteroides sp.]|nr:hypothetical protein [Bacteroides sp.]
MIDPLTIQKLRDLPIEDTARRLGLDVQKHKSLCPFHEDRHPSLSFHTGRNTYKCFVCNAHGGPIDLTMHILGKDFKEACRWLSGGSLVYGVESRENCKNGTSYTRNTKPENTFNGTRYERFFQRPFLNQSARQFLFQERKLHPAVIRWCRLHSYIDRHGTSWLQIPYFDMNGKLIGVQNRRLTTQSSRPTTPRFIFPSGSKISIYNLPVLKLLRPDEPLWIAEGCSDCWALLSSGRKAIAIPSATLLKSKDLNILKEIINQKSGIRNLSLHMYPDADIPGEKLYLRLVSATNRIGASLTRHSLPTGCKDFSEYYLNTLIP